jgi:hypothetical protein
MTQEHNLYNTKPFVRPLKSSTSVVIGFRLLEDHDHSTPLRSNDNNVTVEWISRYWTFYMFNRLYFIRVVRASIELELVSVFYLNSSY